MGKATSSGTAPISPDFRVAIIGAGIAGINLAIGLQARNVPFTLYERAPEFREIGAGIGFSPNSERAMALLDPEILASFKRIANPNGEDYFQWNDGHVTDELIFKLFVGKDGFQGCRRSDVLEEWAKLVDPSSIQFNKQIDTLSDPASAGDPVEMRFTDGTSATASVVIGCDGIRSRVRQLLLPADAPAAHPHYTAKYCFRALVPMAAAVAAVGTYKAGTRFMFLGPRAHIITYPIGGNTVLNVLAVLSDDAPWPDTAKHTAPGSKSEVVRAFAGWHPTVTKIADLLPDEMDKWAIFDMAEHPVPTYVRGRVGLAGDAAHATGPHLGAGGGLGIEDAAVLAPLLEAVARGGGGGVERALGAYNEVRYQRTQDIVQWTRQACDYFHWTDPEVGSDFEKFGKAITPKFHAIWEYDINVSVEKALAQYKASV
ncbi:hypothetical protein B0T25DRAFT_503089 [Lasiosphaeria hispida]|uniref:FAD-binding domain-containing protein n=1 Tax=Lasiosphaeria hispida TaxID=260671 RepID=A0AAJ0HJN9_9PEZI|nr:hypothetical protein B0T25DRAFT_503089 [Lasiosphaeria hispida]